MATGDYLVVGSNGDPWDPGGGVETLVERGGLDDEMLDPRGLPKTIGDLCAVGQMSELFRAASGGDPAATEALKQHLAGTPDSVL